MTKVLSQLKTALSNPQKSLDNTPGTTESIIASIILLALSALLLIQNTLSLDILSCSFLLGPVKAGFFAKLGFALLTQIVTTSIPFFVVAGKSGFRLYISNLALIQFIGLLIVLVGFLFGAVFWQLYKVLPISGLTIKAIFEAIFLLYPVLVLIVFRYILLWMLALRTGASPAKITLMAAIYVLLCFGMWFLGGLI